MQINRFQLYTCILIFVDFRCRDCHSESVVTGQSTPALVGRSTTTTVGQRSHSGKSQKNGWKGELVRILGYVFTCTVVVWVYLLCSCTVAVWVYPLCVLSYISSAKAKIWINKRYVERLCFLIDLEFLIAGMVWEGSI